VSDLADFITEIPSGLTANRREFRLDPDRLADLRKKLDELATARAQALAEAHHYWVRNRADRIGGGQ
jgi:hypothetical protein